MKSAIGRVLEVQIQAHALATVAYVQGQSGPFGHISKFSSKRGNDSPEFVPVVRPALQYHVGDTGPLRT